MTAVEELIVFGFDGERLRQLMPVIESLFDRHLSVSDEEVMSARFDNQRKNISILGITHQLVVNQCWLLEGGLGSNDFQGVF